MEIPLFLAMTAAEFRNAEVLPMHPAWMACHFSSYGTGLSNIPQSLPAGSMLMLNDRTPICGHMPQEVAQTLCEAATTLACSCILLDFQRAHCDEAKEVVHAVLDHADCPVGVSALYADNVPCPVLVPPIAPHIAPEEALAHWKGRELWLEISPEGTAICVTEAGSQYIPLPRCLPESTAHSEPALHCHYQIQVEENQVVFQLGRTDEDQRSLSKAVRALGVTRTVGLWQEFKGSIAIKAPEDRDGSPGTV